ncbi:MAG TPA: anti-sigma factor [Burkholderiales bacterium]
MKLENGQLRERLAAEYVLGTMPARARRRFSTLLKQNPALRRDVMEWESRLLPLVDILPGIQPPARVWAAIEARIQGNRIPRRPAGFWQNLSFWRASSFASAALALALVIFISLPGPQSPETLPGRMVVVMNDMQTQEPAMTATWEHGKQGERIVRLRVMGHAEMAPGTAWEMWLLQGENQKPVSLGLITTHETQTMVVPAVMASQLDNAAGLAMSVEPAGGSPTGLPTGPVLYYGKPLKT